MARVRDGDRSAFEALYSRFGSPVMRFLFRLCGDRELAEDLTQEVFVRVWRAAPRWQPLGKVSTWLFQIAKRVWWNEGAKRTRRANVWRDAEASTGETAGGDADAAARRVARDELALALQRAITELSQRRRLVFVLVRLEGCSLAEAAAIAGIPVGTVKSRVASAEAALRRRLRKHRP